MLKEAIVPIYVANTIAKLVTSGSDGLIRMPIFNATKLWIRLLLPARALRKVSSSATPGVCRVVALNHVVKPSA
jgi:hypothetical protein